MKRILLLIGLIAMLAWLVPRDEILQAAVSTLPGGSAFQSGETDPYWVCSGRTCVEQSGCGVSSCQSDQDCGACDPGQRDHCLFTLGWWWDDWTCICSQPPCDPAGPQTCAEAWGTWHEDTCWCDNPCNPGQPQVVSSWYTEPWFLGCTGCMTGLFTYSTGTTYEEYCQDGRTWRIWEESEDLYYETWAWECFYDWSCYWNQ